MKRLLIILSLLFIIGDLKAQSSSTNTFMNPVIPGDHPDCTLTKVGSDYYTTGSSFNITPTIYHSKDLVHWRAITQPVSAAWSGFGDSPGGGCWGGHVIYYKGKWWDYFSRGNVMHFVTADKPEGPWSTPTRVNNPSQLSYALGYDNSIFLDDDGKWYLVVKNGQPNNGIVELGDNGQPTGIVYNLDWLNPSPSYPYSWAEGPVMWKYRGYYYYSFARDLAGGQKVMRSKTLTADKSSWEIFGDFFNENDPLKYTSLFTSPNHASNVITIEDSTFWVIHPLYAKGEWKGQGRQGLLNQVRYDSKGKPVADYPVNKAFAAPKLPSGGIPWMVPHTDFFNTTSLNPEWSFLGYTANSMWSLTDRPGWLRLSQKSGKINTLTKNDGEHNYTLITRLEFNPSTSSDEAGLLILRGDEKSVVKLYSSVNSEGKKTIYFSFDQSISGIENTKGDVLWLKIVRVNHTISGYFSSNGSEWTQVGNEFNIASIDSYSDFSTFTGTRQGLYVRNSSAYFDCYIYRDAYTPILADCPANQYGTTTSTVRNIISALDNIHDGDWAMYAGVEFGNNDYLLKADSIYFKASSATTGGSVEVWLDSLDSKIKITECKITSTGGWDSLKTFKSKLLSTVTGNHDVYLKFKGSGVDKLFLIQNITFIGSPVRGTNIERSNTNKIPAKFGLEQNYPNPFNPSTIINYQLSKSCNVQLKVFDLLGREIATLVNEFKSAGDYSVQFSGFSSKQSSGIYFYTLRAGEFLQTKKMLLVK